MKNNNGFTLLELLVAATIIGVLAVFATVSYKNSAADARMAEAKARANALAGAIQRFKIEYPALTLSKSNLYSKGFGENYTWDDTDYVSYSICAGNEPVNAAMGNCAGTPVANPRACVKGKDLAKQVARYKSGYMYCVSDVAAKEKFATGK